MKQRLIFIFLLGMASLFLGACEQIDSITQAADVSQIQGSAFYGALQGTVALVQIPVILLALLSLLLGWKLGRMGLALNGFTIGGLLLYTYLKDGLLVSDANFQLGLAITGAVIAGILAYFLYNLMALLIGGAIGSTLMNGAWLQVADTVPPQVLVFATTFVSALVMFFVFRLFAVAFSAVIGAAILMLAVPFETLWVVPVAIAGTVIQIGLALMLKDDIFQNMRGDFSAALGQAFGELLGPFGTLREHQKAGREKTVSEPRPARKETPKAAPQPKPVAPQQSYQAPQAKPAQPAPYQAPQPKPVTPPAQQSYQAPYQAPQANYQAQPIPQNPPVSPQSNPAPIPPTQPQPIFRPEQYQLVLSTGQSFPLVGSQITVGRNADNVIVLNDAQVSGYHLMLSIQAEGVVAWDNNSTNGTLFNGLNLIGAVRLTTNDVLQLGAVSLRLVRVNFQ